jgi:hypothetical protein
MGAAQRGSHGPAAGLPALFVFLHSISLMACARQDAGPALLVAGADPIARAEAIAALPMPTDCSDLAGLVRSEFGGLSSEVSTPFGRLTLRYRPAELIACMGHEGGLLTTLDTKAILDRRSSEEYVLEVLLPKRSPISEDTTTVKLVSYLASQLQQDVKAVYGADTLACAFVHVEQGAGLDPVQRVILGFDRPQGKSDRLVRIAGRNSPFGEEVLFRFVPGAFEGYEFVVAGIPNSTSSP